MKSKTEETAESCEKVEVADNKFTKRWKGEGEKERRKKKYENKYIRRMKERKWKNKIK